LLGGGAAGGAALGIGSLGHLQGKTASHTTKEANMAETKTYQEAYQGLIRNAYAPVFFEKLATSYGIKPSSDEEAVQLLSLAGKLRHAETQASEKTAGDRTTVLAEAHRKLDQLLGMPASSVSSNESNAVKVAAAKLSESQEMRDAALLYRDFLTQASKQTA
jgi:hypothetical protein